MSRIDLDQARRRAKELLKAARAGDTGALARLPRRHDPVVLADAQLAIAREIGYPSWPALIASVGWTEATYDDVDWRRVQRVTVVPFLADDSVVIPEDGMPSDEVREGEDAVVDTAFRITLEQCGFRRQGTHVFAVTERGTHVAMWAGGDRYAGERPHRRDSHWWTGPAAEVDDELVRMADVARRSLTHEQRVIDMRRILDRSYLDADTPQGGSGFSGSREQWDANHRHIADAVEHDGSFLDVGCANGFLLECMVTWCAARGIALEPFGVDVSDVLVDHARARLPQWTDRIWVGDALTWSPHRTFDVVHGLLDMVAARERRELIDNLLTFVAPGGRLVLSHYRTSAHARSLVEALGYQIEVDAGIGVYLRQPE